MRLYDPWAGVWLTREPLPGDAWRPQTWHRYAYAFASPISYYDAYGYWPAWLNRRTVALGAAMVAAAVTVATAGTGAPVAAVLVGAVAAGAVASGGVTAVSNVVEGRAWYEGQVTGVAAAGGVLAGSAAMWGGVSVGLNPYLSPQARTWGSGQPWQGHRCSH